MSIYHNKCGKFEIDLPEGGHPVWVRITDADEPNPCLAQFPQLIRAEDLHDLKHLVDRAIEAFERHEDEQLVRRWGR